MQHAIDKMKRTGIMVDAEPLILSTIRETILVSTKNFLGGKLYILNNAKWLHKQACLK